MIRRPLTLMLATFVATASGASCSLLVSTDGFAVGATDAATGGDGGVTGTAPGDGGAKAEGGVDGSGVDAAVLGETSIGFCAANPGHTFCDDFDDRTDVTTAWTDSKAQGRGVVRSDTAVFRSAPRSFVAETPAGANVVNIANINRDVGSTDHLRVSFDFHVTAPSGGVGDSIGTLHFSEGYLDVLWFTSGEFRVTERVNGSPNLDHIVAAALPSGSWARVQIESTPGHIGASINGIKVIDAQTAQPFTGAAGVSLGLFSQDVESVGFNYDNVLIDTQF